MAELGLVPNATLHLKLTGKPAPPTTLNITSDMAQALKAITAGGSTGVSKLLGTSASGIVGSSGIGHRGGIPSDYSGVLGSSMIGSSALSSSDLDTSTLLSGISAGLSQGLSPGLSSSILGLSGVHPQYYSGSGMSAAVVAAASLNKQASQSALNTSNFPCPGLSTLVSCSMGPNPHLSGGYTVTSSHSSPRSHPSAAPSVGSHHPSPSPRRTPSPALPVIPPNLHPALTSTLPQLCLPGDTDDSSLDDF